MLLKIISLLNNRQNNGICLKLHVWTFSAIMYIIPEMSSTQCLTQDRLSVGISCYSGLCRRVGVISASFSSLVFNTPSLACTYPLWRLLKSPRPLGLQCSCPGSDRHHLHRGCLRWPPHGTRSLGSLLPAHEDMPPFNFFFFFSPESFGRDCFGQSP